MSDFGSAKSAAVEPTVVQIRPDPYDRRQVARWLLALFEISILVGIASLLGSVVAGFAGAAIATLIGNNLVGTIVPGLIWWFLGGLIGAYLMLRFLAS
jgi:hypothetical protein